MHPSIDELKSLPMLSALPPETLEQLASRSYVETRPKGTVLVEQDDRPSYLFFLLAGTVVCGAHIFDTDRSVQFIHASEFFPLNAVVLDELTLSYYTAVTPCRLMRLPAQEIRVLLDREPAFARAVLTETSYYCRDLIREKQGLYIRSGADRLAAWLLAEAHRAKAHGPHEVSLPKGKISEILDFAPEMLSRYLATLRDHGVSSTQTAILIDDPDALAAFLKPQHRERLTNAAHMPFGRLRAS